MSTGVSFGILSSFDHSSQEWNSYKSRLNQWFIANDITNETDKSKVKRRAILLSALSESTFKLASDLALPRKAEDVDYEEILRLLDNHFTPKRIGFSEKSIFYSAMQQSGESHTQWAARIRGLAAHCGFKNLEEALLDRFIMGMIPGHERDKLFAQDQREMTLAKAVDLAESVRCARLAAMSAVAMPGGSGAVVTAAGQDGVFAISKKEKCSVCGFTNHKSVQCRFKNYKCKKCSKKGHLGRMCTVDKVKYVEEGNMGDEDDGESFYNIRCDSGKPMTEKVYIGDLFLEFEIDSGSAVSVISESTYKKYFPKVPLLATNKKLLGYTGTKLETCGVVRLPVAYSGSVHDLDVFVVRSGGPPLLGRDFIHNFKLELAPAINTLYINDSSGNSPVLQGLIKKFPKTFSGQLGAFNKYTVELRLKPDSKPIFHKARPVPYALRLKIDKELDHLVNLGVLKPVEHSEYASPIVPVLKKDGKLRLCADYSVTINKQLIIDQYPLPTIKDLFAKLNGGVQFSKIDLSMAYNQFILNEPSQALTCINTHRGLFKYTRLVFGLSSAPAIFQRAMECLLAGLEGVVFLLDDVLCTGRDAEQHKQRLTAVLQRLEDAGLTIQASKCEFFKHELCYLGHIIDKNGVRKSPDKVKAILEVSKPENVTQLQSFLGLTNYYRNFIPEAASILYPLYNLLHKNVKWEWTSIHEDAFNKIKKLMATDKYLAHFDPHATLILTVDASPVGLGAVLSQIGQDGIERPVSYASRTLNAAEKKYAQIQKEATAIIFGVRRFHQYLYGRSIPFILRTDHKPLLTIFGPYRGIPEVSANRLQRYAIFLSAYNYRIEYVKSSDNSADFLSRAVLDTGNTTGVGRRGTREAVHRVRTLTDESEDDHATYVHFVLDGSLPVTSYDLQRETDNDAILNKVKFYIFKGWPRKVRDLQLKPYYNVRLQLSFEKGILLRGHKVVIPTSLRDTICKELHSSHFGVVKMKAEARKRFWFPGIDGVIERLAAACSVCAALRPRPPHAPLAPWPYPPHPFYRVHLDFLGPFNNQMFLIIVDAYSKWVECYTMMNFYGTKAVVSKLYDFMARVGIPHTLVTDNGTSFTSQDFKDFCLSNGIKHVFSPPYHPVSNGQAESFVKIIKKGLQAIMLTNKNKKNVTDQILKFLFDYRNSKNSTTGKSPAELLYGKPLRSRLDLINPIDVSPSSSPLDLTQTIERQQCLQGKSYKGKQRKEFKRNELVWTTKNSENKKFCWIKGLIREKIGSVMFKVFIPELNREVTRHVDQIRARTSTTGPDHQPAWNPDVVPDIQSMVPASASSTPSQDPGREKAEDESASDEFDSTFATPPPAPVSTRRRELTPISIE
ncbi:uncharacterized protein K02A2.6-like [Vanessa atalanta]|uniref:uncharacterized protein K02A2.6-like n=1 Tax=Vanessa atalanta TaxID=42275 RepID=UPI001FCD2DB4|nr:uncharacterized protein K02A2.6-like [Vanessa atalanta]